MTNEPYDIRHLRMWAYEQVNASRGEDYVEEETRIALATKLVEWICGPDPTTHEARAAFPRKPYFQTTAGWAGDAPQR
jgi:hypothetical protein